MSERGYGYFGSIPAIYGEMNRRMRSGEEWRGEGVYVQGLRFERVRGRERLIFEDGDQVPRMEFRVGYVLQQETLSWEPGVMLYHTPQDDTTPPMPGWRRQENP